MQRILQPSKSSVWSYFKKLDGNAMQCKLFQMKLAFDILATTSHNHLRVKHSEGGGAADQH